MPQKHVAAVTAADYVLTTRAVEVDTFHCYRHTDTRGSLVVSMLDQRPRGRGVRVPLAAGGRVATVGQLLFAPWAWAYSTLHPLGVGK